ncbi:MAG TPA: ACP S-malonyltransferase [Syntrophomonadaceae bacterium]|nr:ACP S-malonyltransferase [Syntrophomonadaceae bacterium]
MRLAFVFPGQGAQYLGMGQDLARFFVEAAEVFGLADQALGFSISDMIFFGEAEELNQTEYAQPAILTCSLAALAVARKFGIEPDMVAGLSLGEYTALVAAGALSMEEALPLVHLRGRLMQEAVPAGQGAMAAVLGKEAALVDQICADVKGQVAVANYNCPKQVVISGSSADVQEATLRLKEAGARVTPLAISVPSHCTLMKEAAETLRPHLEKASWKTPAIPVISNVEAQPYEDARTVDLLARQLYSPVLWEQSVRFMMEKVDYFVEIGPGTSLSGLIKRIGRDRVWGNLDDFNSLGLLLEKVNSLE